MERPSDLQLVRDREPPRKGWVEPIVALLMALTTVGTAWCSYQSAACNEQLANFYVERFPPDVRKAYDAWLAQRPFENPNADPHPFVPRLYEPRGTREAADATAKAASALTEARSAGSTSGQYLANTVLFATVLFFASASGKFEQQRVRSLAFAFAVAVFVFALVRTAMLPL